MFIIVSGFIFLMSLVVYIVVRSGKFANHHIEDSEPDNPLLLTIQAMESELDELRQNNAYMKHIQKLEKRIKEAEAHAEALSNLSEEYDNTVEEVGEPIAGGIGGRNAVHIVKPVDSNGIVVEGLLSKGLVVEKPEEKIESTCENESETDKKTREYRNTQRRLTQKKEQDKIIQDRIQNTAIYRTYTSQTGWSTYYDVELKQSNSER